MKSRYLSALIISAVIMLCCSNYSHASWTFYSIASQDDSNIPYIVSNIEGNKIINNVESGSSSNYFYVNTAPAFPPYPNTRTYSYSDWLNNAQLTLTSDNPYLIFTGASLTKTYSLDDPFQGLGEFTPNLSYTTTEYGNSITIDSGDFLQGSYALSELQHRVFTQVFFSVLPNAPESIANIILSDVLIASRDHDNNVFLVDGAISINKGSASTSPVPLPGTILLLGTGLLGLFGYTRTKRQ